MPFAIAIVLLPAAWRNDCWSVGSMVLTIAAVCLEAINLHDCWPIDSVKLPVLVVPDIAVEWV
jgi:hypothetical protein